LSVGLVLVSCGGGTNGGLLPTIIQPDIEITGTATLLFASSGSVVSDVSASITAIDKKESLIDIQRYAQKIYQIPPAKYTRSKLEMAVRERMNLTGVDPNYEKNFKIFAENCFYIYAKLNKEQQQELADFGAVMSTVESVKGYDVSLPAYKK